MKLIYDFEGILKKLTENTELETEVKVDESLSRDSARQAIKWTGVAFAAGILQACGVSEFFGFAGTKKSNDEADSEPLTNEPTKVPTPLIVDPTDGPITGVAPLPECSVLTVVDVFDDLELATGNYVPKVKMYGTIDKIFLAMHFENAPITGDQSLKSINVMTAESRILALKGFTGADIGGSKYRPFIMDNLHIRGTSDIKIVVELMNGERYKFIVPAALETKYDGKDVVGISAQSVPSDWVGKEGIANFGTEDKYPPEGFMENKNLTYGTQDNKSRFLYTAQNSVVHTQASLLTGMELTDIMGNPLPSGNSFTDIREYQTFIAYKIDGNKAYRTIIKVV